MHRWLGLAALLATVAHAAPTTLTHQGRLVDASGAPIEGAHTVHVRIYDQPTGGTLRWSDSVPVTIEDGYYSVQIGATTPFGPTHAAGSTSLWVGVAIDTGAELVPRTALSRVPFAMEAATISAGAGPLAVEGLTVGGEVVVDATGHIPASRITGMTGDGVVPVRTTAPSTLGSAGQLYVKAVPGQGGDDGSTVLLMHGDAAGSTFTDASVAARALTAVGTVANVTTEPKLGATAIDFRSGGSVTAADSADWDFPGDFAIDFWIKLASVPYSFIIVHRNYPANTGSWHAYLNSNGVAQMNFDAYNSSGTALIGMQSSATIPIGVWTHVAITRSGSTARMFFNGVQVATDTTASGTIGGDGDLLRIGDLPNYAGDSFNGWLDEIRISKGDARWSAPFSPPTLPYDDGTTLRRLYLLDDTGAEREVLLAP
jgi:hypothetical protein